MLRVIISIGALNTVDDTHIFLFVLFQEDFDSEQMSTLASCLAELFKSHFRGDVLPEDITEEYVSLSFSTSCQSVCTFF